MKPEEVAIAKKPCGCYLTDTGQDVRCAEHALPTVDDLLKELRSFSGYISPERNYEFGNKVANEMERLQAFKKRILALQAELIADCINEDGTRCPYMLLGDDADILERLEKAIHG